jgi:ubiquinone/menaquinone biosynthesis C-methylase UbiE
VTSGCGILPSLGSVATKAVTNSESVIALYDKCRDYRRMHRDIYGADQYVDQLDFWTRDEIAQFGHLLQLRGGSVLLDLGSGLGGPACLLSGMFNAKIVCIDIAEWHINEARAAAARLGLGDRINFSLADARTFDGDGRLFDAAIAIDSIVYMDPVDLLLKNLTRLLKPGSRLLLASECLSPQAPHAVVQDREKAGVMKCIIERDLEAALNTNGFQIESVSRDFQRRERFARAALRWMDDRGHRAGRENMAAILNACENGGAFEILIVARAACNLI